MSVVVLPSARVGTTQGAIASDDAAEARDGLLLVAGNVESKPDSVFVVEGRAYVVLRGKVVSPGGTCVISKVDAQNA